MPVRLGIGSAPAGCRRSVAAEVLVGGGAFWFSHTCRRAGTTGTAHPDSRRRSHRSLAALTRRTSHRRRSPTSMSASPARSSDLRAVVGGARRISEHRRGERRRREADSGDAPTHHVDSAHVRSVMLSRAGRTGRSDARCRSRRSRRATRTVRDVSPAPTKNGPTLWPRSSWFTMRIVSPTWASSSAGRISSGVPASSASPAPAGIMYSYVAASASLIARWPDRDASPPHPATLASIAPTASTAGDHRAADGLGRSRSAPPARANSCSRSAAISCDGVPNGQVTSEPPLIVDQVEEAAVRHLDLALVVGRDLVADPERLGGRRETIGVGVPAASASGTKLSHVAGEDCRCHDRGRR